MKVSVALVLAAALGSSAHASRHGHRHVHRSAAGGKFVMAVRPHPNEIPPVEAPAEAPAEAPVSSTVETPVSITAEASSSSAPAPPSSEPAPSESASSGPLQLAAQSDSEPEAPSSGTYKPFCGGKNKNKRATLAQILYKGNTGVDGDYGCNMMEITPDMVSEYQYTTKFVNQGDKDQKCVVWNKVGRDGGINGFFKNNEVLNFKLGAKGTAKDTIYVAFDKNSQVGASCHAGEVPLTSFGQFASTWFEADFGNAKNNFWSGFDVSTLVADRFKMATPPMKICSEDNSVCSTVKNNGQGGVDHDNAYKGGMEDEDGVGGNIHPGRAAFTVMVDYQG